MQIKNIDYINNQYNKEENTIKTGEILHGTVVSETEDKINIQFENTSLTLPKNQVKAKLGESVSFKVLENNNNKLSLKEIYNDNNENLNIISENQIYRNIKEDPILDNGIAYKKFLQKGKDTNAKDNLFMIKELKDSLNHTQNAMNEESIANMFKNGLDPEKNTTFTMSDFITKSFNVDLENEDKEYDITEEKESNIKCDLNMNGVDEEEIFNFEEILLKSGIPNTAKNIEVLKGLQGKFEKIDNLDTSKIHSLLKKEANITLEDLYTAKHSGTDKFEEINLDSIKNIDEQIANILTNENISLTDENINIAKDFIKNQVEISRENFDKYNKLLNIQDEFNIYNILEKGAKNIGLNKSITDIEIFENTNKEKFFKGYKQLIEILPSIKTENIQNLINNKVSLNLKNIQEEYNKQNNYENIEVSKDAILERLNLAKIQMKLTTEAIYRLSDSGIDINTKPLQNVINTLENMEIENYKSALKIANAPINNENINQMQNVFSSISKFYPKLVYSTFKEIANNEIDFSINGISESIKSKNILNTLETFKTVPDARFGDKVSNLKGEFEKILSENGFEITESNLKSAKILTLNNMDFNAENLINVKLIDSKIDYVYSNLHPIIASNMIKDGFNMLDRKIDDLIDYIDNFSNKFGQTSREKIAEQILELDKENKLTKEERSAIISVYRMLNLIEKDGSSSIGTLLKNEKNVTLGNLLEASKTFKKIKFKKDFDFKINDKTEIKEGANSENNIVNSIEKGLNSNLEYNNLILNRIINNITPEKVLEYAKNADNVSIEKIYEDIKNNENISISENKKENILKNIREFENVNQETINYMIKNNIPITLNNIANMDDIIKENNKVSNSIEDFKNELEIRKLQFGESIFTVDEETQTLEQALNTVNTLEEENNNIFDDILNLDELDDIKYMILKNKAVSSSLKFIKDINIAENGVYNLPLRLSDGKITDLNMLILNNKALNEKNVNLFLQFENNMNENLQAYVKVSENGTFANITMKTENMLKNIKNSEKDILNILKKFNIEPDKIKYSVDENKNIFDLANKENIENRLNNLESEFEITV